jgi:glycosyltransferase involved in cell wall biosynthesis
MRKIFQMNKKLTVWILQTGEPLHIDEDNPRPMRAMNLTNALIEAGHNVVLWSSSFYHQEKRHRVIGTQSIVVSSQLSIRLISSPGYVKNIGLGRLWDHVVMGYNLSRELRREHTVPDIAFIGYPPIEAAAVMTRWLKTRGVPCVVDVKDQWPLIFINALPSRLKFVGRILFAPYYYLGKRAMKDATGLSAMANGFLQWAVEFAGRTVGQNDRVVPLTVPRGQVSTQQSDEAGLWWDEQGIRADGTHRVIFVGSHSRAFDIEPVYEAATHMAASGMICQFIICGDGENSAIWRSKMKGLDNVYFPGWIDRTKIEALALRSTAALAPYNNSDDFVLSVPNKVIDAFALGLPVLSPLSGEVQNLIVTTKAGMSYGPDFEFSLAQCMELLFKNNTLQLEMSKNAKTLYQMRFAFDEVYIGLVKHLEQLALYSKSK